MSTATGATKIHASRWALALFRPTRKYMVLQALDGSHGFGHREESSSRNLHIMSANCLQRRITKGTSIPPRRQPQSRQHRPKSSWGADPACS